MQDKRRTGIFGAGVVSPAASLLFFLPGEVSRQDLDDDSFESFLDGEQCLRFGQLNLSCRDDQRILDAHLGAFGGVDLITAGAQDLWPYKSGTDSTEPDSISMASRWPEMIPSPS